MGHGVGLNRGVGAIVGAGVGAGMVWVWGPALRV